MLLSKKLHMAIGDNLSPCWWIEYLPGDLLGSGGLVRVTRWWYGSYPVEILSYRTDRAGD